MCVSYYSPIGLSCEVAWENSQWLRQIQLLTYVLHSTSRPTFHESVYPAPVTLGLSRPAEIGRKAIIAQGWWTFQAWANRILPCLSKGIVLHTVLQKSATQKSSGNKTEKSSTTNIPVSLRMAYGSWNGTVYHYKWPNVPEPWTLTTTLKRNWMSNNTNNLNTKKIDIYNTVMWYVIPIIRYDPEITSTIRRHRDDNFQTLGWTSTPSSTWSNHPLLMEKGVNRKKHCPLDNFWTIF